MRKTTGSPAAFEASVERIALMLRSGIHDNQIIAMRKTNPDRAAHLAELRVVVNVLASDPKHRLAAALARDGRAVRRGGGAESR